MRVKSKIHHRMEIAAEVGCDGPSLPIMTIALRFGDRVLGNIMLGKEDAEQVVKELQRLLAEM